MNKTTKILACAFILSQLSACNLFNTKPDGPANLVGELRVPVLQAWHEGEPTYYITTDLSDEAMAGMMNANYAPRLKDAVPSYPKPPELKTVLERVYVFPKGEQANGVFASAPTPVGPKSTNTHYSPLWLMVKVTWNDASSATELRSEAAILQAEEQGKLKIELTDVVVNCPIVSIDKNYDSF